MSRKKKRIVNFDEIVEQAGATPETFTTIEVEEVLDSEETNDYIEEVEAIVPKDKPKAPVVVEQFQAKHDMPIAKKLKLPNRPIY